MAADDADALTHLQSSNSIGLKPVVVSATVLCADGLAKGG